MNRLPVVEADGLRKSFGEVAAVSDATFSVGEGQVLGLLGPNGAGKTTAVKMLTTLFAIDGGSARVAGFDVSSRPEEVRKVIGLAGQAAAVDEKLTARENLELFARLYKIHRRERRDRIGELVDKFDMNDFADRPVSTYSGGQRRRLDIVAALVAKPLALFLDEPTTGLDPRSRSEVWDAIRELASEGAAILLTTQYLDEADHLADEIVVIDQGRTIATGSPASLKKDVGSDVLEVHVATPVDLAAANKVFGRSDATTSNGLQIDIPIAGGASESLALLRGLGDADVSITDFQLRRPTLDDVFLTLTGARPNETGGNDQ